MPEHLKALVVIVVLATAVLLPIRTPLVERCMTGMDFARRRNLWLAITLIAFLSHNFWIYIAASGALLLFAGLREPNRLALYYFLLFAVPMLQDRITGLGIINHFFAIDYLRLLSLTVLLPAFLELRRQPATAPFGRLLADKLLGAYLLLQFGLMLQASTFTDTLRQGLFYAFLDAFLPYYVASRLPRDEADFRDALAGFVVAALVLAPIAVFEYSRHWLLYGGLETALGSERWGYGQYLERGGLRALGSVGQPIVLGYVMTVALGFFLYLRKFLSGRFAAAALLVLLLAGLYAPLSRGPWMGAIAMVLIFIAVGPSRYKGLVGFGLLAFAALSGALLTAGGEDVLGHLPFSGSGDSDYNVLYRQRLLEISLGVIAQNPFFGAYDYFYSPAMQQLKQGDGIIDLVNTYLGVGLGSGLVGLSLFVGFFVTAAAGTFVAMRRAADGTADTRLLGRTLLSTLMAILVIIFTVSSVIVIPAINWSVAGLCVAYACMVRRAAAREPSRDGTRANPISRPRFSAADAPAMPRGGETPA